MKVYRLYLAKPLLVFYLLMLAASVVAGFTGIIVGVVGRPNLDGPPEWIFVIFLGFALLIAYMCLRIPFEIKVRDDTAIEFRSVLRRITISPVEIKSVRAKPYALGFIDVVHVRDMVHLSNQMDGFHELISTLKSLNPAVHIQGY
jgi:hypothetical protein